MLDLKKLVTEQRNENTLNLDEMEIIDIVTVMNEEDIHTVEAVKKAIPEIVQVINWTSESLQKGGRIIYTGAGTSGRLGVLDAVECPPTFGVDDDVVVGIIAGGERAFVKAKEGAEDSKELGAEDLKKINLNSKDTVVGLATSGRTPYVIGALRYAKEVGCKCAVITCNPDSEVEKDADCTIEIITGPEVLTGSTRLKAGTAEKMVLNMISTASMVTIGKTYSNLMIDVKQTNEKLVVRTENIVMDVLGCDREKAKQALQETGGDTKLAIAKELLGCDAESAAEILKESKGKIKVALENNRKRK